MRDVECESYQKYAACLNAAAGKTVLDVLCGNALLGASLLARFAKHLIVIGGPTKLASAKYDRSENLSYLTAYPTAIPLRSESVDLIVCFNAIDAIGHFDDVLSEFVRVLRPQGTLITAAPGELSHGNKQRLTVSDNFDEDCERFVTALRKRFEVLKVMRRRLALDSFVFDHHAAAPEWKTDRHSRCSILCCSRTAQARSRTNAAILLDSEDLRHLGHALNDTSLGHHKYRGINNSNHRVESPNDDSQFLEPKEAKTTWSLIHQTKTFDEDSSEGSSRIPQYVARLSSQISGIATQLDLLLAERASVSEQLLQTISALAGLSVKLTPAQPARIARRRSRASLAWRIVTKMRRLPATLSANVKKELVHLLHAEKLLRHSKLFDAAWYLAENPDVLEARFDPIRHYLAFGAAEERNPSSLFSTAEYLLAYPDVKQTGINPLVHYLRYGRAEGRSPRPLSKANLTAKLVNHQASKLNRLTGKEDIGVIGRVVLRAVLRSVGTDFLRNAWLRRNQLAYIRKSGLFDPQYYVNKYPDVAAGKIDPLVHYLTVGASAGLNPHPLFDSARYLAQHADVREAGLNPLAHYVNIGAVRGYDPHPLFNNDWYLAQYPDVRKAGINPLAHYIQIGAGEDRDPHPLFNSRYYRDTYFSGRDNKQNLLIDYVEVGAALGRNPNPAFDAKGYMYDHPEVNLFGGNALAHYLQVGRAAGFDPHPLFERSWYEANNRDAWRSGMDAYEHYVRQGLAEGRLGSRALGKDPNIRGPFPLPEPQGGPDVAIVIPVYKSYFDTYRCLVSISRLTGDNVRYQVIVADDCPEKPVVQLLTDHPGLNVIFNDRNLGFLHCCNRAASLTKGKFIVFLNNDTIVRENWLAPMVAIAEQNDRVGMVGCKLLNSDGTIQEAGGSIPRNGWGVSYGRDDDSGLPEYNFVREVDCVIGACILVRRSIFVNLGGFDSRYAPAFYEEFDLAFACQELSYRVVYQPASEVYHFGSASYGTQVRDHQSVINHAKFCRKWASRLIQQPTSEAGIFRIRERAKRSGTILIIEESVPEHDKHAGALTIFQYVQLLVQHDFKVIFLPHNRIPQQPYTRTLQQMGVEILYGNFDFAKWLDKFGHCIDRVLIARPDVAKEYIEILRSKTDAHIMYYTHDLHFLREMRRYEVDRDPRALAESFRLKPIEVNIFNSVDCVTTPSDAELPIIRELSPLHKARLLIPLFFKRDKKQIAQVSPLESRHQIIFVGGYAHLPNVDAAIFLVNSIMPLVWREVPRAEVLIVGSNPPPTVTSLHGKRVKVTGYVPDLAPYYELARVSISPLRFGAGMKGKIISSLEAGVPVVTTTIGNEGIALRSGVEVLLGDTAEELAALVVRLFKDDKLLNAMAVAGRRIIGRRFSEEKARDALFDAIELQFCSVCGNRSRPTAGTNFACEQCRAPSDERALADALIYPYRRYNCSSVCEALPFLEELRIHEFNNIASIYKFLQTSNNFSHSFGTVDDDTLPSGRVQNRLPWIRTIPDEEFDLCISREILDSSADTIRWFRQIHRVLKPDGRHLFIAQFSRRSAHPYMTDQLLERRATNLEGAVPTEFDFTRLLKSIGFIVNADETCLQGADDMSALVFEIRKHSLEFDPLDSSIVLPLAHSIPPQTASS